MTSLREGIEKNYDSLDSVYSLYKNATNRKQMQNKADIKRIVVEALHELDSKKLRKVQTSIEVDSYANKHFESDSSKDNDDLPQD